MFRLLTADPRMLAWQGRLSRVPRWTWIAIALGIVLPLVVVFGLFAAVAVVCALVLSLVAGAAVSVRNVFRRLAPRAPVRQNVQIVPRRLVVHSDYEVIDSK